MRQDGYSEYFLQINCRGISGSADENSGKDFL